MFALGWTVPLLAVPAPAAMTLGPVPLFVDTAAFGAFFNGLLLITERAEGALAALRVTPLRADEQVAARLGVLTGLSVVAAVPIVAAGQAVLVLLVVAGYAANKVHGLAPLKLLGGAVMVLAALPWLPLPWLPVPAQWPAAASWPVALLPPAAVSLTQQAGAAGAHWHACGYAALGATVTVVGATLLARRGSTRFTS